MPPLAHPGRLLWREIAARQLSASRLALDLGVPSGRITDILNGRRSITADTAVRLGRYFGNPAQFWLDLQGQFDIATIERERGAEMTARTAGRRGVSRGTDARSTSTAGLALAKSRPDGATAAGYGAADPKIAANEQSHSAT